MHNDAAPPAADGRSEFLNDLRSGLARTQKSVPGKYLWDEAGSVLFDAVCDSADYYPTRRETALLRREAKTIARMVGPGISLVEYGSGASHKIRILLDALDQPRRYVAIDISHAFLHSACSRIARDYPDLDVVPVCADYTRPIELSPTPGPRSVLGFFPGTTIGNFDAAGAVAFLSRVRRTLGASAFLVGVDPNSDRTSLSRAYADRGGRMAALHGNLLIRIARETGADLDPADFRHEARVLGDPLRVEAHLVALRPVDCEIAGEAVSFAKGESIHTDTSHKYEPQIFRELAAAAGWDPVRCWTDEGNLYSLHLLRN